VSYCFNRGKFNRKEGVFMDDRTPPHRSRLSLPILGLASALGVGLGAAIAVALHNPGVGTATGTTIFVVGRVPIEADDADLATEVKGKNASFLW
jgi:hypothetical protein